MQNIGPYYIYIDAWKVPLACIIKYYRSLAGDIIKSNCVIRHDHAGEQTSGSEDGIWYASAAISRRKINNESTSLRDKQSRFYNVEHYGKFTPRIGYCFSNGGAWVATS